MQSQHEAVGSAIGRVAGAAMAKPSQGRDVLAVLRVNEGKAAPSVGVHGDDGNSAVNGQRDDSVLAHVPASTTRQKETTHPRKVRQAVVERSMRRTLTADPVLATGKPSEMEAASIPDSIKTPRMEFVRYSVAPVVAGSSPVRLV